MNRRFLTAMGTYVVLGILSWATLTGPMRGAVLIFLGGLAVKTWIARLQQEDKPKD